MALTAINALIKRVWKCFAIQIIPVPFNAMAISTDFGKLYVIDPIFSIDYGWLGTPSLSHHILTVKRFLTEPSLSGIVEAGGRLREWAPKSSSEQVPPAGFDA